MYVQSWLLDNQDLAGKSPESLASPMPLCDHSLPNQPSHDLYPQTCPLMLLHLLGVPDSHPARVGMSCTSTTSCLFCPAGHPLPLHLRIPSRFPASLSMFCSLRETVDRAQ